MVTSKSEAVNSAFYGFPGQISTSRRPSSSSVQRRQELGAERPGFECFSRDVHGSGSTASLLEHASPAVITRVLARRVKSARGGGVRRGLLLDSARWS